MEECAYCGAKRTTYEGTTEADLKYYKLGFVTNKLRYDDYELLMHQGFTRSGSYCYERN